MSYQRGDLSGLTSTLASQQAQSLPRLPPGGTWLTRLTNTRLEIFLASSYPDKENYGDLVYF